MKEHEFSDIVWHKKRDLIYLDKVIPDSRINLNSSIFIISYYSEWCPNCHYDSKVLAEIFNHYKYRNIKFELIMMYASFEMSNSFVKSKNLEMSFQMGELLEKNEELLKETYFTKFKLEINDTRKWGVPLHLVLGVKKDIVGIIKGEIIKENLIEYLNDR